MTSLLLEQAKQALDAHLDAAEAVQLARWKRYVASVMKQLPITDDNRTELIAERLNMYRDWADDMAAKLYNGDITIGQWQESMKAELRQLHSSMAAISRGGFDRMRSRDWGRLGPQLHKEYKWLAGFAEHISANRDTISLEYIQNRARLYGHGAEATSVMMEADFYFSDHLPWLPKDGSTECLHRCRCHWSLDITGVQSGWQIVKATWTLNPAEHCGTCVSRAGHTELMRVPPNVAVPDRIGGY